MFVSFHQVISSLHMPFLVSGVSGDSGAKSSFGCVSKPPVVAARARAHLLQTSVTPGLLQTSVARTFVSCILYTVLYYIKLNIIIWYI